MSAILNSIASMIFQSYLQKPKKAQRHFRVAMIDMIEKHEKSSKKPATNEEKQSDWVWKSLYVFLSKFKFFHLAYNVLTRIEHDLKWKIYQEAILLNEIGHFKESNQKIKELNEKFAGSSYHAGSLFLTAKNLYFSFSNFQAERSFLEFVQLKKGVVESEQLVFLGLIYMQRKNYLLAQSVFKKVNQWNYFLISEL